MTYRTLISAPALHAHLHDPNWVIVDCRFELSNPAAGRTAFKQAHLPGALYAHLDEDLSGVKTTATGRHPLPDPAALRATFSRWGIDEHTQVIAYDNDSGAMAAARLWWLLRWLGHQRVAVLDGGMRHWLASGFELSHSEFTPATRTFNGQPQLGMVSNAQDVAEQLSKQHWRVLDARAPERYAGSVEPIDAVAGHVPGAMNLPFTGNLNAQGHWLDADSLRQRYQTALGGVTPSHTIMMCGSGVTAAHNLLAMETAGLHGARLYAGSWSEWITDPQRPVARSA